MKDQTVPILIILVAAFIGACAQYFFKMGSLKIMEIPLYKNWFFLSGLVSFFWVLVLMTLSFRFGGVMMIFIQLMEQHTSGLCSFLIMWTKHR